jgi:MFS family permease
MAVAARPTGVRGFARLAVTYTANDLGDQIGLVALAVLVFDQTGSALAPAALFVVARSIPALIAPVFQATLDRRSIRLVLPAIYLVEALAFAALAVLSHHFVLSAVLAISLLDGVLALTGRAISRSTLALIMRPHGLLREGNNIINVCFSVSNMVGPVIGGVVVAAGGPAWGLGIDAALFLVMAAVMAWPGPWPAPEGEGGGWRERLRSGLSYARRTPGVGSLILADGLSVVPLCLVVPVLVVFAKESLGAGDAGYGILQGAWGAGIVLGSVLLLRFRGGALRNIIATGLLAVGVSYIGIGISPVIVLACLASVVGGVGNGIESITLITAVQALVPDEFMGRVSTLMESVVAGAMGIGFAIGGVITDVFDPRVAYVASGVAVLLCVPLVTRAVRTPDE